MRVQYDFLRVGSSVEPRPGFVYLDIGNQKRPGVVDTHSDEYSNDDFECSSTLIWKTPSLVTDAIPKDAHDDGVTLVVHENPDYDCIASLYLARRLIEALEEGKSEPEDWSVWAPILANSARAVDRGETRILLPVKKDRPRITPYLCLIALNDIVPKETLSKKEAWRRIIEKGHVILQRALDLARRHGISDIEKTDLRGQLAGLGVLESVIDAKVAAFDRDATRIGLRNETRAATGIEGVFPIKLPVRGRIYGETPGQIACITDPECGGAFFKSVVRGAFRDRIQATLVFSTVSDDRLASHETWVRPIISVDPDSPYDLRGLGRHLDDLETEVRERKGMPLLGRPRPGFNNSDPWYDGRAFAFTIVDAPRFGTILCPEEVHREVIATHKWLELRIDDVAREMLQKVRSPKNVAQRTAAFASLAEALKRWSGDPKRRYTLLYVDSLDAVATLATDTDAAAYKPLLERGGDFALAFLNNNDPRVRVDALIAVTRSAKAVAEYVSACGRNDLTVLNAIVSGVPADAAKRLAVPELIRSRHALLFDAVAARVIISGPDGQVLSAAVTLAIAFANAGLLPMSIANLHEVVRATSAGHAAPFEEIAGRVVAKDRAKAPLRSVSDAKRALQDNHIAQSARMLHALIVAGQASEVLGVVNDVLKRMAAEDVEADEACQGLVEALQAAHGTAALAAGLDEVAAQQAVRISAAFIGHLLRAWPFDSAVARLLLAAALRGEWQEALDAAQGFVLTAQDRQRYLRCRELTTCAAAVARSGAEPIVRRPQDIAFLVHAALAVRAASTSTPWFPYLAEIASSSHPLSVVDEIGRFGAQISGIREQLPERVLLEDAEAALAQTNLFARAFQLLENDESPAGRATCRLLRIGVSLPDIDWESVDDLVRLERRERRTAETGHEAVASAYACGRILTSVAREHALVADVHRIRAAAAALSNAARSGSVAPIDHLARAVLRAVEQVLDTYANLLDDANKPDNEMDELSLRMLEASTVATISHDYRLLNGSERTHALTLISAVAGAGPGDAARATLSRIRRSLGRHGKLGSAYERAARRSRATVTGPSIDRLYQRVRELLGIPEHALDTAYVQHVDTLIRSYDMRKARQRIDEHSFEPFPWLLRFWMSGWAVIGPVVLLVLFAMLAAKDRLVIPERWIHAGIGTAVITLVGAALGAIATEVTSLRRSSHRRRGVDSLRYKLFLPHFVLLVLFGVYTAAMTEELALHMALELGVWRFAFVAAALFGGSVWALRQVIQRHARQVSLRHAVAATGRLLAYAFVMALSFNAMVSPMVHYEFDLHSKRVEWIGNHAKAPYHLLPDRIEYGDATSWYSTTFFPRHVLLNALFGMFIGIFLRGFWKVNEKE